MLPLLQYHVYTYENITLRICSGIPSIEPDSSVRLSVEPDSSAGLPSCPSVAVIIYIKRTQQLIDANRLIEQLHYHC